jgi:outer membrane biosynthesis protein TonB
MISSAPQPYSSLDESPSGQVWFWVLLFAVLLHLILLMINPTWTIAPVRPPVAIEQIDSKKLDAIRSQWKKNEKSLLLSKNQKASKVAPLDARYESDRNSVVDREQRSTVTNVVPKAVQTASNPTPTESQQQKRPSIRQLGIPMIPKAVPKNAEERQQKLSEEGGDQALLEKNLPQGSQNMLNAQESIYYSFYSRLYESVGPIWQSQIRQVNRKLPLGEYTTSVEVIFDRQGNLLDVRQIQGSGIVEFDQAVPNSWRRIGNFPNPPSGLLDSNGQVHTGWTFTVNVGNGPGFMLQPPERVY